jgi:hypothetical protein
MRVGADTNMTPTLDFCVGDCQHNHATHNHNPAAPLLRHSHATGSTHPLLLQETHSSSTGRMGERQESSGALAAEQQQQKQQCSTLLLPGCNHPCPCHPPCPCRLSHCLCHHCHLCCLCHRRCPHCCHGTLLCHGYALTLAPSSTLALVRLCHHH